MTVTTKIGFGAKVHGKIEILGQSGEPADTHHLNSDCGGKILVVLAPVGREFLEKAGFLEVAGVVVPSLHWRDYDYLQKRSEYPILLLTKFGRAELSTDLRGKLGKLEGKEAVLDGEKKTLTA